MLRTAEELTMSRGHERQKIKDQSKFAAIRSRRKGTTHKTRPTLRRKKGKFAVKERDPHASNSMGNKKDQGTQGKDGAVLSLRSITISKRDGERGKRGVDPNLKIKRGGNFPATYKEKTIPNLWGETERRLLLKTRKKEPTTAYWQPSIPKGKDARVGVGGGGGEGRKRD